FNIENAVVFRGRVYVRSGERLYSYGGLGATLEYDETEAEGWLPLLDADTPAIRKALRGVDLACEGEWEIAVNLQPTDQDTADVIGRVYRTTYNEQRMPAQGAATHFGLRLTSKGGGPRRVSAAAIHYTAER